MSARAGLLARRAWGWLRALAGDDAYERYCAHQVRCHPGRAPLDRHAFYRQELERRWSGVSRCC
ncbi:MAG TPA: YbdD/YjiX family protein [Steroidobacteraceae bacterium]|nr:YbdD/YjiX family protein [Steroidobacteraceae bacterium]